MEKKTSRVLVLQVPWHFRSVVVFFRSFLLFFIDYSLDLWEAGIGL